MPVDDIIPLNQTQRIPEIKIDEESTTQPHTYYTCPTGKKAFFEGVVMCTTRAASPQASLRDPSDTFDFIVWNGTAISGDNEQLRSLAEGVSRRVKLRLDAGDVIKTAQSVGTTAQFIVIGKVLELPA